MRLLLLALLIAGSLAAQPPVPAGKLPVRGEPSQELQLYDLAALIEARADLQQRPDDAGPALAEFARAFVQPALQNDEDVKALGAHHLVGLGRADLHGWVHGFLRAQLEQGDRPIELRFRVLHAHDKALQRAGLWRDPVVQKDAKALKARLDKLHGVPMERLLAGKPAMTAIVAPRLLTQQLQRAAIAAISQTTYIKGYELVAGEKPGDADVAVPQQETAQDGVVVDCRAAVLQKDRVGLLCKIGVYELERPIRQEPTPHGPIGVPVIHRLEVEQPLDIPAAGGVLWPLRRADGRHLVVVVTATPGS